MRNMVVDVDYILLDYAEGYRKHCERMFGREIVEVDQEAFWAKDRYDVPILAGDELTRFRESFDETFWDNLEALDGAVEAYRRLSDVLNVVACTASDPKFNQVRQDNLRSLGFTGITLYSVGQSQDAQVNPKADIINRLNPIAVVDDLPLGLTQLNNEIYRYLIARNFSDPRGPIRQIQQLPSNNRLFTFYYDGVYDQSGLTEVATHLICCRKQLGF